MYKAKSFFGTVIGLCLITLTVSPSFAAMQKDKYNNPSNQARNTTRTQSCESREAAIRTRMTQLVRLSSGMESTFDNVSMRVQEYYKNSILSSGKAVSNYNALVTEIANKKNQTQTAINNANSKINSFGCTTSSPSVLFGEFRTSMQTVKSSLKDYRTSIRNLIDAVRTVSSEIETSPTATPTK